MLRLWIPRCWRPMLEKSWSGMRGQWSASSGAYGPSAVARGDTVPGGGDRYRPHVEEARLGVVAVGAGPVQQGVPELGEDEVVREDEEHPAPTGQGIGIRRRHRDARPGGVLVDGRAPARRRRCSPRGSGRCRMPSITWRSRSRVMASRPRLSWRADSMMPSISPTPTTAALVGLGIGPELEARVAVPVDGVRQAVQVVALRDGPGSAGGGSGGRGTPP